MLRLYLLAFLAAFSHQAVYQPSNPWLQFAHFTGGPNVYQIQRAAYLQGLLDGGRLGISPSPHQQTDVYSTGQAMDDAHARFRSPYYQNSANDTKIEDLGRLFLTGASIGSGASANYLLKTSFVFTTSTATLCFMSSCIPAGQFALGSSNVICRRKREKISPSVVEAVEPTPFMTLPDLSFKPIPEGRQMTISAVPVVDSSMDSSIGSSMPVRGKRFLYLLTTTLTTYKFFSSTYTTTLSPGAGNPVLVCRPSSIALC